MDPLREKSPDPTIESINCSSRQPRQPIAQRCPSENIGVVDDGRSIEQFVLQAFGKQGSSVINTLLESGKYTVKGTTSRPLDSDQVRKITARGVEMVRCDIASKEQLVTVFRGAYAAYLVRPLISPVDPEASSKEFTAIQTQADAAAEANLQHVILSWVDSPSDAVQAVFPNDLLASHRKTIAYVESLAIPTVTVINLAFFYSNSIEFGRPIIRDDGSFVFAQPFPESFAVPYVDPYTATGPVVQGILANPSAFNRLANGVPIVSEYLTGPQFAEIFEKTTGIKATYKALTREEYLESNGFNASPEYQYAGNKIYNVWFYTATNSTTFHQGQPSPAEQFLGNKATTWEQFLQRTQWRVCLTLSQIPNNSIDLTQRYDQPFFSNEKKSIFFVFLTSHTTLARQQHTTKVLLTQPSFDIRPYLDIQQIDNNGHRSCTSTKSPKDAMKKRSNHKFTIDCTAPGGKILDVALFEKYLHDRIKVNGKLGNLSNVVISRDKQKIVVSTTVPFSKRYLKYLTKKFLKKKQIRDFLRVIATNKNTYELRYFSIANPDELEEDDE
eukprot:gene4010-4643_t